MASDDEIFAFCKALPKCELHAHLNGSIRMSTLHDLARISGNTSALEALQAWADESGGAASSRTAAAAGPTAPSIAAVGTDASVPAALPRVFALFGLIHELTASAAAVRRVAREAAEDFAADGCVYLELRTGPKHRPEAGLTKRSYAEAVLAGVGDFYAAALSIVAQTDGQGNAIDTNNAMGATDWDAAIEAAGIDVRVVLSVDRRESPAAAAETVALALELATTHPLGHMIVGVDLGGDPALGRFENWRPALEVARAGGLGVTLHCGEVVRHDDTDAMVAWAATHRARLGHLVFLSEAAVAAVAAGGCPLEICLTSNVKTGSVPGYADHHLREWLQAQKKKENSNALVLCTDDPSDAIFGTTLSREYAIAAHAFGLGREELAALAAGAAGAAFLGEEGRAALRGRLRRGIAAAMAAPETQSDGRDKSATDILK